MREVELKAVVDDVAMRRARVEAAGGVLVFVGRLEDCRYDTRQRTLIGGDLVLRVRTYRDATGVRAHLDWKGPTERMNGFKVRDELSTAVEDGDVLTAMLDRLGYEVIREIDRRITQYEWQGTTIRFEEYPRMDVLVEVEGTPEGIEAAIAMLGLPRPAFNAGRIPDFIAAFEQRTGLAAALSDAELASGSRRGAKDG